ncbi:MULTISPECIES: response regulator [unclassified Leptolyngbya]|uniref:response regulator n=1 Tax=unclassified Leptolyngbya TaxID=2650499 RepID=UPI0016859FB1|nr:MULTISPECIES: response regulator [unclassified Leptolyngbya]MBD1908995.1 response regulator [Leptolyngbya sp. FACHB-8]MBD2158105.1 response regulator [Leptolyngbya sp. FACHB-16]
MTKRILIIDDEDDIREVVQICLSELGGWETITAASGSEGLKRANTERIDAILLDVSMPEMDGFRFFELLQENSHIKPIPVILLTAKILPDDQVKFAEMEVAGVITKPFNPAQICQQIAEILSWEF